MPLWILAALGFGGYLLAQQSRESPPGKASPPPEVTRAVQTALAQETRSDRLADFAASMAPTYPQMAAELHAQSLLVHGAHPITAAAAKRAVLLNPAMLARV